MNAEEQALLQELDEALAQLPADISQEEIESLLEAGNYQVLNTFQDKIIPEHSESPAMVDGDFLFRTGVTSAALTIDQIVSEGSLAFSSGVEGWSRFSRPRDSYFFFQAPVPAYNAPTQPAVALGNFGNIQTTNDRFVYYASTNVFAQRLEETRLSLVKTVVESNDLELAA